MANRDKCAAVTGPGPDSATDAAQKQKSDGEKPGRDKKGLFVVGNLGGPGRPRGSKNMLPRGSRKMMKELIAGRITRDGQPVATIMVDLFFQGLQGGVVLRRNAKTTTYVSPVAFLKLFLDYMLKIPEQALKAKGPLKSPGLAVQVSSAPPTLPAASRATARAPIRCPSRSSAPTSGRGIDARVARPASLDSPHFAGGTSRGLLAFTSPSATRGSTLSGRQRDAGSSKAGRSLGAAASHSFFVGHALRGFQVPPT
jgi:hypothetical protein